MKEFFDSPGFASTDSPRLFENPLLDKLSRIHHLVPPAVYLPLVLGLLVASLRVLAWPTVILGFLGGYLSWTLVEYLGHRFLFHFEFPGEFGARIHFLIHGVHHDHPNDPLRLVMPLLLSAPIMAAALLVLLVVSHSAVNLPLWAGFILGYIGYDMVHFYVHHARPTAGAGLLLQRRHLFHHFRESTSSFGVSAPWWDHVFGTAPKKFISAPSK